MSAVKEQTNDRDRSGAHRVVQGLGSSAERPQEDEERDVERGSIAKTGEDRPPTHAKVEQRVNQEELGLVALHAHGGERSDEEDAAVITSHRAGSPVSRTPPTT